MPGGGTRVHLSRRRLIAASALGLVPFRLAGQALAAGSTRTGPGHVRIDAGVAVSLNPTGTLTPISPFIYGANEAGIVNGVPSATLDAANGVTARRLGGNRLTGYNWTNNFSNAGTDYLNESDNYLPSNLGVAADQWLTPASVITTFHDRNLAIGSRSLVTLQMAGYVSADGSGVVTAGQVAPSSRWQPISYQAVTAPPGAVCMDEFVAYMVQHYGAAGSAQGIQAFQLDNEPALWPDTHPLLHPAALTYGELFTRSVAAAQIVKRLDPTAEVSGPVSFGFSELYNLQNAADAGSYAQYGTFVGAYLATMQQASAQFGARLLDTFDFHWYPETNAGGLAFGSDPSVLDARLQAPRSLWDASYVEPSWIGQYYGPDSGLPLRLPLLPVLQSLIDQYFPGTGIAITEYNYGDTSYGPTGLAIADLLGVLGAHGVHAAHHWGLIADYVAAAFQLYRNYDGAGGSFGAWRVPAQNADASQLSAWAAADTQTGGTLHLVLVNKTAQSLPVPVSIGGGRAYARCDGYGFDTNSAAITHGVVAQPITGNSFTASVPAYSAWHYVIQ